MAITIVLIAVLGGIAVWWLSHQRLMAKPWLEEGVLEDLPDGGTGPSLTAKLGLGVFLAVVSALFALFASAYLMRMHLGDWESFPKPWLLWVNTGLLVASSLALQWALLAVRQGRAAGVQAGLVAGAATALLFLVGQLLAFRQLASAGVYLASNPSSSFFYLITVVHGLHLLGGLVALGRAMARLQRSRVPEEVRLGIELCTYYWHFLLLVWLAMFALLLHT